MIDDVNDNNDDSMAMAAAYNRLLGDTDRAGEFDAKSKGNDNTFGAGLSLLLFFPLWAMFFAAILPVRLARARRRLAWWQRIWAYVTAFAYGSGVLYALGVIWLWPCISGLNWVFDAEPGAPVSIWYVLSMFAVLLAMPGWAWLITRKIEDAQPKPVDGNGFKTAGWTRVYIGIMSAVGCLFWGMALTGI